MSDQFATPSDPGAGVKWAELNGSLLVIDVHGVKRDVGTSFGNADEVVQATVTVADGPQAGTVLADTLIFPRVLVSQLNSKVGSKVLGRLGQGVAKPGQSAPWMLNPATDADKATAGQLLAQLAGAGLQQAPPAQQAPAPPQAPTAYVPGQQPGAQPAYVPQGTPAPTY